ncbi:hypothetical protein PSCICO_45820 [Pseudomonas cichorii]|uniref:hypothetical protein n=1 Tax=Pseudomonas cichorii TaxID=36746 RepID=UPI001910B065|nr:hypothetical protein [Pseudomonas cichorii]GFM89183.1 hypothetical protein PSCICO_45820 [Pseudomonas cichorii]
MNPPIQSSFDADAIQGMHRTLTLLALALSLIASPTIPPLTTKAIAIMAQRTVVDGADVLITAWDLLVVERGGQ